MFNRTLQHLSNRIRSLVAKARVRAVQQGATEILQLETPGGLVDRVERLEQFGFASATLPGADALRVYAYGASDHPIATVTADARYRPTNLAPGDACLYNAAGDRLTLKASRGLEASVNGASVIVDATQIKLQMGAVSLTVTSAGVTIVAPLGTTTFV